ncbi:MAG: tetratricopeptide repeat protein [Chloroflexota bacterium]|nr:tetratricopeptide repeat protein [Chloroflexota bacterium]
MSEREAETITLLFSDIEGSTRRWEHHPRAMALALARHDALLRAAIQDHGGTVFKTVGDAFCAVFATAEAAMRAAVAAQRTLAAESWVEIGGLRVRIAIHTGEAERRDNDYFGPSVNRVARLLGAAYGGQVLISGRVAELVREQPLAGISLRDLGQHRLRDLIETERIFQLVASDLPLDFPPPKTLDSQLRGLPVPPTPLIGRDQEVAAVREWLGFDASGSPRRDGARLVTLTGPGGAGKTRLALHLASVLVPEFADGVVFVPLADLTDSALVLPAIAARLEVVDPGEGRTREALIERLQPLDLLMVLDNFEQVMAATPIVAELLAACPRLTVLATSRERLNLRGERELPVPPLPLPELVPLGAGAGESRLVERVGESAAVRLFLDRASATKPSFELTAENAPAIAEICRRLDGLPLAIELAAARIRMLSPSALLGRLDRRLDLLAGGARDLPSRQRTMRNAVAWSYDLLTPEEQRLFARLAIFAGGAASESAEAILSLDGLAAGTEPLDFGILEMLVDKSLVRLDHGADDETRIAMFETIRDYAAEQLALGEEAPMVAGWHARHYLARAVEAAPGLEGPAQVESLNRLERDHANLRAALDWLGAHDAAAATTLGGALWRFWLLRGHFSEGRARLERLIQLPAANVSAADRIAVLNGAGVLAESQGESEHAARLHAEALALARDAGDSRAIASSLNNLGVVAMNQGDYERADTLLNENIAIARELGDAMSEAKALTDLGNVAYYRGNLDQAAVSYQSSLDLVRQIGDVTEIADALNNLSVIAFSGESYAAAGLLLDEALRLRQSVGDKKGIAQVLNNQAEVARHQGDVERATTLYQDTLRLGQEIGDRLTSAVALESLAGLDLRHGDDGPAGARYAEALVLYQVIADWLGLTTTLTGIATIALRRGHPVVAARLLAAAEQFRGRANLDDAAEPNHTNSDEVRAALGDAAFEAAWLVGQGLSVERAVDAATAFMVETATSS